MLLTTLSSKYLPKSAVPLSTLKKRYSSQVLLSKVSNVLAVNHGCNPWQGLAAADLDIGNVESKAFRVAHDVWTMMQTVCFTRRLADIAARCCMKDARALNGLSRFVCDLRRDL